MFKRAFVLMALVPLVLTGCPKKKDEMPPAEPPASMDVPPAEPAGEMPPAGPGNPGH